MMAMDGSAWSALWMNGWVLIPTFASRVLRMPSGL